MPLTKTEPPYTLHQELPPPCLPPLLSLTATQVRMEGTTLKSHTPHTSSPFGTFHPFLDTRPQRIQDLSRRYSIFFFFSLKYHNLNYLFLSLTCNSKSAEMGHGHSKSDFPCQLQPRSELTTSGLLVSGVVAT